MKRACGATMECLGEIVLRNPGIAAGKDVAWALYRPPPVVEGIASDFHFGVLGEEIV